jgi:biotin synthase
MRRDNARNIATYLMSADEILAAAEAVRAAGINIVFLQGGEIPQTTELVGELLPNLCKLFNGAVEILLCLGKKTRAEYAYLKAQGATSYILKHETSDVALNETLRQEPYAERLEALRTLLALGYKVGTGTIVGLPGQSRESLVDDILLAKTLNVHMASASPFVPATNTPLADKPVGDLGLTLNVMAAMRLTNPSWLIPSVSALERTVPDGQRAGLRAGGNVLTINFTPTNMRKRYSIYGEDRYVVETEYVQGLLKRLDLHQSGSIWVPN